LLISPRNRFALDPDPIVIHKEFRIGVDKSAFIHYTWRLPRRSSFDTVFLSVRVRGGRFDHSGRGIVR
ncbi:MAG: hypothetical protein V3R16_00035, partial [Nitrospirales bacterium]